ncbi:MAG: BON domain-containing protein, partial [Bacteriovoracaceae bacterium]
DASEIEVDVKDGVVTLSGTVEDRQSKRAAEECIENLSGVVDVHNRIRLAERGNVSHLRSGQDENDKSALS